MLYLSDNMPEGMGVSTSKTGVVSTNLWVGDTTFFDAMWRNGDLELLKDAPFLA